MIHLNKITNKQSSPLCKKSDWDKNGDTVADGPEAIKQVTCAECKRLVLKAKRKGRDKKKTYIYSLRRLVKVFCDEMDAMTDNGLDPHQWMKYPKTEEFIKQFPLSNRPDFTYFIDMINAAIVPTFCKHENKTEKNLDGRTMLYICSDCKYAQYRWTDIVEDDNYNTTSKETYSRWEKPQKASNT